MYFDFILYEKMDDELINCLVEKTSVWEVFHVGTYEVKDHWHYLFRASDLFEAHRIVKPVIQRYKMNIKSVHDPEVWRGVLQYYFLGGKIYTFHNND